MLPLTLCALCLSSIELCYLPIEGAKVSNLKQLTQLFGYFNMKGVDHKFVQISIGISV